MKTIISMAGNPNYVNVTELPVEKEDDGVAYSRILDKDEIMEDADGLLRRVEGVWPDVFDTEPNGESYTIGEHLQDITEKLGDIEEEMEREFEIEHGT